jgi:Ca2+-binding EF-hand superfamily protein
MNRMVLAGALLLNLSTLDAGQSGDDKAQPKKGQLLQEIVNLSPEKFIERFDKDKDGKLTRDELPPFLAKGFEQADRNGDGKLDREEVAAWLPILRKTLAAGAGAGKLGKTADEIVENLLKTMDADKDGKISRAEAKGKLAESFDKVDTNKDGYLDRQELRAMAQRILAAGGGPAPGFGFGPQGPDFDALDKNADGRLTPDELKGTPWAARFAEIDTDRNGYIDRREFENFLRREKK